MLLVDTNVLVDALQDDPVWGDWSIDQMRTHAKLYELAINPVIYAELSMSYLTIDALDADIDTLALSVEDIPHTALFLAGKAFLDYRRRGGTRAQVLPDFFIGAHASVRGWPLLTRDAARYRSYFPRLTVVSP